MTFKNLYIGEWLVCPDCGSGDVDYSSFPDGTHNLKCNDCGLRS